MKKDFVIPILVLSLICMAVSGALAAGNMLTEPAIEAAAAERALSARMEIIPNAAAFTPLSIDGLPGTIAAVYKAEPDAGYVFVISTTGYGGEIEIMCGIGPDGKITSTKTLKQTETKGLGTVIFDNEGEYRGKDEKLDGIDAVSGATITSNAYMNGIKDAFKAFKLVKEAGK